MIECYENGLLTKEQLDGLEMKWGNAHAIIEMIKKIARREGVGDILADGVKVAFATGLDSVGGFTQHLISGLMAEAVVYLLEIVEVQR